MLCWNKILQNQIKSYFFEGFSIGNQKVNDEYSWVEKRTKDIAAGNEKAISAKEVIGWLVNWFKFAEDENGKHDITALKNIRSPPCRMWQKSWGLCLVIIFVINPVK